MSGGDGKDHNSGAHDSGGSINGGPTGFGKGGGSGVPANYSDGIGSGIGDFKVASQRYEGGWVNSYNSKGYLVGASRPIGDNSNLNGGNNNAKGTEYNADKYSSTGGFAPLGDASWTLNPPTWKVFEVRSENSAWRRFITHVAGCVYGMSFDKNEKLVTTDYINYENPNDTRYSPIKNFNYGKPIAEKQIREAFSYEKAVSAVSDFYSELTSKYGDKFSKQAQKLAEDAKGKTLRNAPDAIKAFEKYKNVLNKKFSVADREAIAKALESLDKGEMAKQLTQFSKAFSLVSGAIQWNGFRVGLVKGFRTGDWNDAIISGEGIIAGKIASALVTVTFSMMAVNPIGIFGFAMIMAITGALITDKKLQELNDFIMSL